MGHRRRTPRSLGSDVQAQDARSDACKRFGEEIKRRRLARGLTQAELAQAAGMSTPYISSVERGARDPSRDTIMRLAFALDVPPGALLGPIAPLSETAIEVGRMIDEADPELAESLLALLRALNSPTRAK